MDGYELTAIIVVALCILGWFIKRWELQIAESAIAAGLEQRIVRQGTKSNGDPENEIIWVKPQS